MRDYLVGGNYKIFSKKSQKLWKFSANTTDSLLGPLVCPAHFAATLCFR